MGALRARVIDLQEGLVVRLAHPHLMHGKYHAYGAIQRVRHHVGGPRLPHHEPLEDCEGRALRICEGHCRGGGHQLYMMVDAANGAIAPSPSQVPMSRSSNLYGSHIWATAFRSSPISHTPNF